ncbi:accessory gene regulator B family protein [Clostridium intestinale]|uniref:accessory gene regulator B family protein n=1 Tax=Clostridium intestinale TaxID=36845 RepID=UPI003B212181
MIELVSEKLTNYISSNSDINASEIPKIHFAIKSILSESSKFIIMFIIFFILGTEKYFLLSFIILCPIRAYSGGIHFYTYKACLVFSMLVFFITSYLTPKYIGQIPLIIHLILSILSLIIIYIKSPQVSKYRKKMRMYNDSKIILSRKLISTFLTLLFLCASFLIFKYTLYLNCAIITIFMQAIQLIPASRING